MGNRDKRELRGICEFGYVDLFEEIQLMGGKWANQVTQKDPNHFVTEQYYHVQDFDADGYQSPHLTSMPENGGGVIPIVNKNIGSPLCTFAYGGIAPGQTFDPIPLIKAPSGYDTLIRGNVNKWLNSERGAVKGESDTNTDDEIPSFSNLNDYDTFLTPTIPTFETSSKYNIDQGVPVVTTYNIWCLLNDMIVDKNTGFIDNPEIQYQNNLGRITFKNKNVAMRQEPSNDTVYLTLCSYNNQKCVVQRLYPLSQDTLYESGTRMYYPVIKGNISTPSNTLELTPRENCGFQMKFDFRPTQNSGSAIEIMWGDFTPNQAERCRANLKAKRIALFRLTLNNGSVPYLEYEHPDYRNWSPPIKLNGPIVRNGQYSVYVHYAGPTMLIGFDDDPNNWNVFKPILDDKQTKDKPKDWTLYLYPIIPKDARIAVGVTNMVTKFQYGPIAFNNFNPAQVEKGVDKRNYLACSIHSNNSTTTKNMISDFEINKLYYLDYDLDTTKNEKDRSPTWYADWRSKDITTKQLDVEVIATDYQKEKAINTKIWFNTSVEGPVFYSVANTPESKKDDKKKIIQTIADCGDVSEYLTKWEVAYRPKGQNKSFVEGEATITLKNLALTEKGRKMLTLLEENILAVKLGGGYEENTNTFFEGIVEQCVTDYDKEGSTTTVTCRDLCSGILSQTVFPQAYSFESMRYVRIIEICTMLAGLNRWYVGPEIDMNDTNTPWAKALNLRAGSMMITNSIIEKALIGTPFVTLQQIVGKVLELIVDINVIPSLYWDSQKEQLVLRRRSDEEISDELLFLGKKEDNATPIPEHIHGVLTDKYTITTFNKVLHTGVSLFSINYLGQPLPYREIFASNKPGESDAPPSEENAGWTGFRKIYAEDITKTFIRTKPELESYGRNFSNCFLKVPYQNIKFEVYVDKPLNHAGKFTIATFMSSSNTNVKTTTDSYFYGEVRYEFDKSQNIMKANIVGENAPNGIYRG